MLDLSPQAQRSVDASRSRAAMYRPSLYRTQTQAIVCRPLANSRRVQADFVVFMREHLPQFHFDPNLNRWHGPLADLPQAAQILRDAFGDVYLSDGASQYVG